MKLWLIDDSNVSKISTKIEEIYMKEKIDRRFIYNFIFNLRKIISSYLCNVYCLEGLAANNANQTLCVDEPLFTHTEGAQTWVFGIPPFHTVAENGAFDHIPCCILQGDSSILVIHCQ